VTAPLRQVLVRAARAVLRRPRLRALTMALLKRAPQLHMRLRKGMRGPDWRPPRRAHMPRNATDLSPANLAAYRALKAAIGQEVR
jgi:hypothetical protein